MNRRWRPPRPLLLAALCCVLFTALGSRLIAKPGLGLDEGYHAVTTISLVYPHAATKISYWEWMPLMRDSYQGPLKSYVLYLPFHLFGASVETLRWTTLSLGTLSLLMLVLLAMNVYGTYLGFLFGLLIATDQALILAACFDTGPAVLMLFLKSCALWFLREWWSKGRGAGRLFAAGLLLGLGLWDKSHFLWFLFSLPISAALFAGELRSRLTGMGVSAGLAGLFAGSSPWLIFNIRHFMMTFTEPGRGWTMGLHLSRLPWWIEQRWSILMQTLTGSGQYCVAATAFPDWIDLTVKTTAAIFAALIPLCLWRKGLAALRDIWSWLGMSALIFMAACLTPFPVKAHHLYLVYPFPQLAFLAALSHAMTAYRPLLRYRHWWVLPIFAFCIHSQLSIWRCFRRDVERTGGTPQWYRGMSPLASWVENFAKENPAALLIAEDGLQAPLTVYSQGRLRLETLTVNSGYVSFRAVEIERCLKLLKSPDSAILLFIGRDPERQSSTYANVYGFLNIKLDPLISFPLADGKPWVGVYRVGNVMMPSFLKAAEYLKRHRPDAARRQIRIGLAYWESIWPRIEEFETARARQGGGKAHPLPRLMFFLEDILRTLAVPERRLFLRALTDLAGDQHGILDVWVEFAALAAGPEDLQASHKMSAALDIMRKLVLYDPDDCQLWIDQAAIARELGRRDLAMKSLDQAWNLKPDVVETERIVLLYNRLNERRRARQIIEVLAPRGEDEVEAWMEKSRLADKIGWRGFALKSLIQAEASRPSPRQLGDISIGYQNLKKYRHSLNILDRLILADQKNGKLYNDRGLCRYLSGSVDDAILDLRAAIRLSPESLPPYATLAAIYARQALYKEALEIYDLAMAVKTAAEDEPLQGILRRDRREILAKSAGGLAPLR